MSGFGFVWNINFFLRDPLLVLDCRPLSAIRQSPRPFFLASRDVFGSSLPAGDGFLFLSRGEPVIFHLVSQQVGRAWGIFRL